MTKYSHLTNEEILRMWDSLEPLYLLEEVRHRMEALMNANEGLANEMRNLAARRWVE